LTQVIDDLEPSDHVPANGASLWETRASGESADEDANRRIAQFMARLSGLSYHAHGGLGVVYKAWHSELNRYVAVKSLLKERAGSAKARARFLREAQITASLEHPGIVPIFGIGEDRSGIPFYVMQFIEGPTLDEAINAFHATDWSASEPGARNMAFRELVGQFVDASEAVAFAHGKGVLHRDLKPSNIIIGPQGQVKVLDWGLAKFAAVGGADKFEGAINTNPSDSRLTKARIGTAGYMSPEQQSGDWNNVDARSDVYSLGVTLFLLCTGEPPRALEQRSDVISHDEHGELRSSRGQRRDFPNGLEAICAKAMRPRHDDRYASALELVGDVKSWLAGEPITACEECLKDRVARWARRHPRVVTVAAVFPLAAFAVVAVAGLFMHRASVIEIMRRADAAQHDARLREEQRRHADEYNSVAYVNLEKTARELIQQKSPGWLSKTLDAIRAAASMPTNLRSATALRSLTAAVYGGVDLQLRGRLTTINSACLAFSIDGRRLAVGEHHRVETRRSCRVQVFEVATLTKVAEYDVSGNGLDTKRTGVSALAFSQDGRWLAAGMRSGTIKVWDTTRQGDAPIDLVAGTTQVRALTFAPGGPTLISGAADGSATLWEMTPTWQKRGEIRLPDKLSDLALSADGSSLALGMNSCGWVVETSSLRAGSAMADPVFNVNVGCQRVAIGPDSQTAAWSDFDKKIQVGANRLDRVLVDPDYGVAHSTDISRLSFHPNGSLLVSGSCDNLMKLWDLVADELRFQVAAVTESLVVPAFSPDGRSIAVGTSEGAILYDLLGLDVMASAGLQDDPVRDFVFAVGAGGGKRELATTTLKDTEGGLALEGKLSFWTAGAVAARSSRHFNDRTPSQKPVLAMDAHPTLPLVVHNGALNIRLYNTADGSTVAETPERKSSSLRFSGDGKRVWGIVNADRVSSWSVPALSEEFTWKPEESGRERGRVGLSCLAAGSRWVLAGSLAGNVYLLRAGDGKYIRIQNAGGPLESIALSPDETMAVCGLLDGRLAVYSVPVLVHLNDIPAHADVVSSLAFDRAGRLLASASRDRSAAIWSVGAGFSLSELFRMPSPSGRPVVRVRFSPDGNTLGMLVLNGRGVRLWDLSKLRTRFGDLDLAWESGM
jgi:WD40 repeat protein